MSSSWNNLPLEILKEIFKLTFENTDKRTLYECVFVCKSWKTPALELLYHTLLFTDGSPLKETFQTLKSNVALGNLVKKIIIFDYCKFIGDESNSFYFFKKLLDCVHNLETLEDEPGHFYKVLILVLIESKLTRLRRVLCPTDRDHFDNYIACAILLKDRLENLSISNNLPIIGVNNSTAMSRFDRLYDRLGEFKKLNELHIEKVTSNYIEFLQETDRLSLSLKSLSLSLSTYVFAVNNNFIPEPIIPRPFMKKLTCNAKISNALLCYIMQKYPQLTYLYLNDITKGDNLLDSSTLVQFLNYILKRDTVIVNSLCAKSEDLTDAIGVCQGGSKLLKTLKFSFHSWRKMGLYLGKKALIHIIKESPRKQQTVLIRYNYHEAKQPANVLEKYG